MPERRTDPYTDAVRPDVDPGSVRRRGYAELKTAYARKRTDPYTDAVRPDVDPVSVRCRGYAEL